MDRVPYKGPCGGVLWLVDLAVSNGVVGEWMGIITAVGSPIVKSAKKGS